MRISFSSSAYVGILFTNILGVLVASQSCDASSAFSISGIAGMSGSSSDSLLSQIQQNHSNRLSSVFCSTPIYCQILDYQIQGGLRKFLSEDFGTYI